MSRQATEQAKIFAKHISDKRLVSEAYRELNNQETKFYKWPHIDKYCVVPLNGVPVAG